jgi:cystathionine beta-lyase/cystathionine gamma-synthase
LGEDSDLLAGIVLTTSADLMRPMLDYRTVRGATIAPDTAWMLTRSIKTL